MSARSMRAASFGAKSRVWYVCGNSTCVGCSSRDRVLQRRREAVGRVRLERGVLEGDDVLHLRGGELCGGAARARARHEHGDRRPGRLRDLLGAGDGFPRGAIELAGSLFRDDKDHFTACKPRRHEDHEGPRSL